VRRLALIGLDAAALPFLEAHAGELPVLARALSEGVLHRLRIDPDCLNGSVWPTALTGCPPGVHGFYQDLRFDADAMRLRRVTEQDLPFQPFYRALQPAGLRTLAVDVPHVHPARRGVEIVNWNSHDHMSPFSAQPKALARPLLRRFGGRAIGYETPGRRGPRRMARVRRQLMESARRKTAACTWLLREQPWDFFMVVFGEAHRGGHLLWPHALSHLEPTPPGALLDVYRGLDAACGRLLSELAEPDTTVLIVSLNGMGENTSQDHLMPALMERANRAFMEREGHPGAASPVPLTRRLRRLLPASLQHVLGDLAPVGVRDAVVDRSFTAGVDWERTPGFTVRGDLNGYVRFSLRGREARGMLEPGGAVLGRYHRWLRDCFESLRDAASGQPLVEAVRGVHELFPGPRTQLLPDLAVCFRPLPPARRVRSELLGEIACEPDTGRSGNHRGPGFCLALNPTPELAERGALRHLVDLAPAVLRHYGVPVRDP
jgi:predicted AlkP superfamily phosphohydrolase/phosphomutase